VTDRKPQVQLRETNDADVPVLFEQQRDPETIRMAAFPSRDRDGFAAHFAKTAHDPAVLRRAILADGELAGSIASFERDGVLLVGYMLGRSHWGHGIATQALALFLDLETRRPLHAHVVKHNVGSIRVLEKNGFKVVREQTSHDFDMVVEEVFMTLT
jgi:RimJ/RimL family protein N-acetyltransferase